MVRGVEVPFFVPHVKTTKKFCRICDDESMYDRPLVQWLYQVWYLFLFLSLAFFVPTSVHFKVVQTSAMHCIATSLTNAELVQNIISVFTTHNAIQGIHIASDSTESSDVSKLDKY